MLVLEGFQHIFHSQIQRCILSLSFHAKLVSTQEINRKSLPPSTPESHLHEQVQRNFDQVREEKLNGRGTAPEFVREDPRDHSDGGARFPLEQVADQFHGIDRGRVVQNEGRAGVNVLKDELPDKAGGGTHHVLVDKVPLEAPVQVEALGNGVNEGPVGSQRKEEKKVDLL